MARFLRQRLAIVTVNARFLDTPRTQRREMGPLPYFPTSSMTGLATPSRIESGGEQRLRSIGAVASLGAQGVNPTGQCIERIELIQAM